MKWTLRERNTSLESIRLRTACFSAYFSRRVRVCVCAFRRSICTCSLSAMSKQKEECSPSRCTTQRCTYDCMNRCVLWPRVWLNLCLVNKRMTECMCCDQADHFSHSITTTDQMSAPATGMHTEVPLPVWFPRSSERQSFVPSICPLYPAWATYCGWYPFLLKCFSVFV